MLTRTTRWTLILLAMTPAATADDRPEDGVLRHEPEASKGFTLFAPMRSTTTYLINMDGQIVHTWECKYPPGNSVYLLDNGHLLRTAHRPFEGAFHGGGIGGLVLEYDWDGHILWEFGYSNGRVCLHHDIEPLPNGNILMIAWEKKSREQAVAAGRDPDLLASGELWPGHVIEVRPRGRRGGDVVWEWHAWDHLIQDHDPAKANYGVVEQHPERIDVNYVASEGMSPGELRRLRAIGYIRGPEPPDHGPPGMMGADWLHINSVDYDPDLDQIALSVCGFHEIWIIDHSTTAEQAASHTGGRCGQGGDLLYRWGNPHAYRAGNADDQQLFAQHDARWIPRGFPGAGHLLVFNNGTRRGDRRYSSVDEIAPPIDQGGRCQRTSRAFGPDKPCWRYTADPKEDFFSGHISGAERLPEGNTLICSGEQGRLFEVTPSGHTVWEYVNPHEDNLPDPHPPGRGPLGPPRGTRVGVGDREHGPPPDTSDRNRQRPGFPKRPGTGDRPGPRRGRDDKAIFRATRIPEDHPALANKDLKPKPSPERPE